jgi:hypothetical protein
MSDNHEVERFERTRLANVPTHLQHKAKRSNGAAPQRGTRVGKLVVRSAADAAAAPPRDYYLKGLISPGELSLWWGEGGCGKTFLLIYIAYLLALGRQIFSRRVKAVRVLYLGLEGETGIEQRIDALRREYGDAEGFAYIAQPLNLFSDAEAVDDLKQAIRQHRAGLVFIDTLNRAIGEGSESADADMGRLRGTFDDIRHETGAHVVVVHHGGKDETRGPRGHSGLLFATDLVVHLAAGEMGVRTATVTRVKDGQSGAVFGFRLQVVELGIDGDGDPVTTCVAVETEATAVAPSAKPVRLHEEAASLLRHINDMLAEGQGRNDRPDPGMPIVPTLSRKVLHQALIRRGWLLLSDKLSKDGKRSESVPDAEWKRLYKRLTTLKLNGLVGFDSNNVWLAKAPETP